MTIPTLIPISSHTYKCSKHSLNVVQERFQLRHAVRVQFLDGFVVDRRQGFSCTSLDYTGLTSTFRTGFDTVLSNLRKQPTLRYFTNTQVNLHSVSYAHTHNSQQFSFEEVNVMTIRTLPPISSKVIDSRTTNHYTHLNKSYQCRFNVVN